MPAALVVVEGVLLETDSIKGQHPIAEAMRLTGALNGAYKVMLASSAVDQDKLEFTLQMSGIIRGRTYDSLLMREVPWRDLDEPELRAAQFKRVRLEFGAVSLFIDSNADACAAVLAEGGNVLLWKRAQYMRPEFRPDRPKPVGWAELEREAEHQVFLRREDERISVEHEESEFGL